MSSPEILNRLRNWPRLYDVAVKARDYRSLLVGQYRGSYAQHGEDRFLHAYFKGLAKGLYLDIGASHPFRISNTYLLYRSGWCGITVEPIPRLANLHRKWRPRDILLEAAVGFESGKLSFFELTPSVLSTIDSTVADAYIAEGSAVLHKRYDIDVLAIGEVFERAHSFGPLDFVSIDIEGLDAELLAFVDLAKYRPSLVCVEVNDPAAFVKLTQLLDQANYEVLERIGCNVFARPIGKQGSFRVS